MEPSPCRRRPSSSTPAAARELRPRPGRGEVHAPPSSPRQASSADPRHATTIDDLNMQHVLLGIYSQGCDTGKAALRPRPTFWQAYSSDVPDGDISAGIHKADDIFLTRLDDGQRWHLWDCRNGVLLLRRDANSLCVYSPFFGGQPVPIQPCTAEGVFVEHCLLRGTAKQCVAIDSFRVVSVQMQRRSESDRDCHISMVRAVVYDSSTSKWSCHKWVPLLPDCGLLIHPQWGTPMYAAGHIFWVYGAAFMFVLDTGTMKFSARDFLKKWTQSDHVYSIGEIEDGKGYLVCIRGLLGENQIPRLEVWSLDASDNNMLKLDFNKEIRMRKLTVPSQVCSVYTVINGLAVVTYHNGPHFVVDLQKETLLATFSKFCGRGYLYQVSRQLVHEESDGDGRSKLIPGNKTKEPPTLSYLDNTCSQSQYVESSDVSEGSGNEEAPCENHHTLKSPGNPTDDEPPKRKKRKATDTNCPGETRKSGGDEPSKLSLDNEIQEPPTLSYLDNASSQSQYVDSPDVSEDRDNPMDDEPPERKKRKANATSNGCPGETTSCDPLVVESETISTTAVPQNSPRVPCRDILVGQQATSQDKHLNEDVLNCPQRSGSPRKSRRKEVAHPKGARRTRSSHVVHDSTSVEAETTSTPAVRHTNQGARCRNSSMGRPARHEKPLRKGTKPKNRHAPSMRTFTC